MVDAFCENGSATVKTIATMARMKSKTEYPVIPLKHAPLIRLCATVRKGAFPDNTPAMVITTVVIILTKIHYIVREIEDVRNSYSIPS